MEAAASPRLLTGFPLDLIDADATLSDRVKRLLAYLHRFPSPIAWPSNGKIARELGWAKGEDGGDKLVSRVFAAAERAGKLLRLRAGQFWRWFAAHAQALGLSRPSPKGRPHRFLVVASRLTGPIPTEVPDISVRNLEPSADLACPKVPDISVPKFQTNLSGYKIPSEIPSEETSRAPTDPEPVTPAPASTDARTGFASPREEKTEEAKSPETECLGAEELAQLFPGVNKAALAKLAAQLPTVAPDVAPKGSPVPQGRDVRPMAGNRPSSKADDPKAAEVRRLATEVSKLGADSTPTAPRRLAEALVVAVADPQPAATVRYWTRAFGLVADGALSGVDVGAMILGSSIREGRLFGSPFKGISSGLRRLCTKAGIGAPSL